MNTLSEIEEYYKAREQQLLKKLHRQEAALAAAEQTLKRLTENQKAPMDETTEQRLKEWIVSRTHGTVELRTLVRPDILGGFIFEMNSMRLDASVATQLREIREQFIDRNKRIV